MQIEHSKSTYLQKIWEKLWNFCFCVIQQPNKSNLKGNLKIKIAKNFIFNKIDQRSEQAPSIAGAIRLREAKSADYMRTSPLCPHGGVISDYMDTIKYVLSKSQMPKAWYNIQADLLTPEDLAPLFPELIKQKVRSDRLNARRKILIENPDLGSLGIAIALAPLDRKRLHIIGLMPIGKLNLKLRTKNN